MPKEAKSQLAGGMRRNEGRNEQGEGGSKSSRMKEPVGEEGGGRE